MRGTQFVEQGHEIFSFLQAFTLDSAFFLLQPIIDLCYCTPPLSFCFFSILLPYTSLASSIQVLNSICTLFLPSLYFYLSLSFCRSELQMIQMWIDSSIAPTDEAVWMKDLKDLARTALSIQKCNSLLNKLLPP